jgi:hypothetical protein
MVRGVSQRRLDVGTAGFGHGKSCCAGWWENFLGRSWFNIPN